MLTSALHPHSRSAGINDSALFVIESSKPHIAPFLEKGFKLVFTGHSLGAGTAALAAAHARTNGGDGYSGATAITFACPGIISAKNKDGSKSAACKAMKAFVTTHILGYDIVPRASGMAVFTLLDSIFSNNWKEKTKKKLEEEAKKKMGAAAGALGGMMSKAAAALPPPSQEEIAAKAAEAKKIQDEIAEGTYHTSLCACFAFNCARDELYCPGRKKIEAYPHILPGGKLRHFVKVADGAQTFVTKKRKFHGVILSAQGKICIVSSSACRRIHSIDFDTEPGAFLNNHK